jgi:DNA-directed RNA polymerase subunit beta'
MKGSQICMQLLRSGSYNGETGETSMIETTVGRVLFNQSVPEKAGYINELLTKNHFGILSVRYLKKPALQKPPNFLDEH